MQATRHLPLVHGAPRRGHRRPPRRPRLAARAVSTVGITYLIPIRLALSRRPHLVTVALQSCLRVLLSWQRRRLRHLADRRSWRCRDRARGGDVHHNGSQFNAWGRGYSRWRPSRRSSRQTMVGRRSCRRQIDHGVSAGSARAPRIRRLVADLHPIRLRLIQCARRDEAPPRAAIMKRGHAVARPELRRAQRIRHGHARE